MKKHLHKIAWVEPGSIAEELGLEPGDAIEEINGNEIEDIFDYQYYVEDEYLDVLILTKDGEECVLEIEKDEDEDLGITFESSLMDEYHSCCNKCMFCFIDQMPPGMRDTLYFKDDDSRLSFLQGNYITLTNMRDKDIERVIKYHLSPINISVHTTNPELRCKMLHNRFAGDVLDKIGRFYEAGIRMNSQVVLCQGLNDEEELDRTISDLGKFIPHMESLSVVADMLRRSHRPVVLVVNKVDNFDKFMPDVYEFYNLGLGDPIPVSAQGKLGIGDMLDQVVEKFEAPVQEEEEEDDRPKIAVIGKPNAGKSSIINKLLGEERVIVSPVAGTTRDAIDTTVKRNGQEYVFIDTAGLRRKSKIKEELERYSIIRTVTAVERCDVAVLIIDATEGITEQDAKIAGIAHERGKGMIIAVNKWDLVEKDNTTMKKFTEKIREKLSYMPYAELIFLSAKTGQRLPKLFEMIDAVIENCALRVQTGVLNEILTEAMAMKQPPSDKGKRLRIYYITQVSVKPPTFVMFINEKKLTHFSYTRYIENQIRTTFGFRGTPIHFIYRERKEK